MTCTAGKPTQMWQSGVGIQKRMRSYCAVLQPDKHSQQPKVACNSYLQQHAADKAAQVQISLMCITL